MTLTLPKFLILSKRQRFVIATGLLAVGIILIRLAFGQYLQWRIRVPLFALLATIATIWAIRDEDFNGIEWLTLPILPTLFAIGAALVNPLLPSRIDSILWLSLSTDSSFLLATLVKMFFLVIFIVGYYASLLTANIFNVAAERSIQLLRVAHSIGFLVSVATGLLFYIVIASFHLESHINFLFVFAVTLLLTFQAVWSVNLEEKITSEVRNFSLIIALVVAEVAFILSFWPVGVSVFALFLTAIFYELVGIVQYHLGEKLNRRVANEFVIVAVVVFVLTLLTTSWSG